ncbi:O-methyltransferase [Arthrobacter roseus]|uniref:O-methyltransferase n=1 Tax=Arthrobacter roseus TaxID=136274 RepID=UPI0019638383|nr:O-methyltransferase [Arthrobacter roseus]MBM7847350.1 putative O-methyltransferase YrrM [Arthrobacter roseus]
MNRWHEVDHYLTETVVRPDDAVRNAVSATHDAGMPAIEVTAGQGKFLMLLARMSGARRILEIGTLGGFSTIWLARGIPEDGTVDTCEFELAHAEVARRNLDSAGVGHKVTIHVGAALDTLLALSGPYDLFFIDADKVNNPQYLEAALRLSRLGSVIVLDNVVRGGNVLNADGDESTLGTRRALEIMGSHPRLESTALQTVGAKDWDGFALAVVRS